MLLRSMFVGALFVVVGFFNVAFAADDQKPGEPFRITEVPGLLTVQSHKGFNTTLAQVITGLREHGFQVKSVINRQRVAKLAGMTINRMTTVLFSQADFVSKMVTANPLAAAFFPMNITVWQVGKKQVYVSFWSSKPNKSNLGTELQITDQDALDSIEKVDDQVNALVESATSP